ncbi:VOC family protein [Streptomyces sp. NPDC059785]|uniref:VOC family protein n=1 Tax=Streptomyces sp. NPDC059785 TaxID=3346945 RepID=UPI003652DE04
MRQEAHSRPFCPARRSPTWLSASSRTAAPRTAELLGWHVEHEEPNTAVVASPQGAFLVFQQADGHQAPGWPPVEGEQHPMLHLDFQVGDPHSAVAEVVAPGATVAEFQPQDRVRVLFDPAGHPFCLCLDGG